MKTYKSILIIITISLVPLLFTATIPWGINNRLEIDELEYGSTNSYNSISRYIVYLEQGSYYTLSVTDFWDDFVIRISDTPYMISGKKVDGNGYDYGGDEIMVFQASRTGDHYIQVINKDRFWDSFNIIIERGVTAAPTGVLEDFFNVNYLLVLILPSSILFLIGLCIFLVKRSRKKAYLKLKTASTVSPYKKQEEKETIIHEKKDKRKLSNYCPFCGNKLEITSKFCPNCGTSIK